MRGGFHLFASALALGLAAPVLAQASAEGGRLVYETTFFAQFSPSNALQMVQRVPGFELESGSTQVRGYGQAAGNVVINGRRPSSKSDTVDTLLSRIPANRVLRIELGSGNDFGADYVGKPQVVNVILTEEGGIAGTLEAQLQRTFDGTVQPKGAVSAILRKGVHTFNGSMSHQVIAWTDEGFDRIVSLPSMTEVEYRTKRKPNTEPFTNFAFGWAMEEAADKSIHVNSKVSLDYWVLDQAADLFPVGGTPRQERFTQDHLWKTYEASGDITRPFAGGALKFNILATRRHRRMYDAQIFSVQSATTGGSLFDTNDTRDERLIRLTWARTGLAGWSIDLGGEGAINQLESMVDLSAVNPTGPATPIDLPIDDALVKEYRGEAFVNASRDLASNVHVDAGLTFEISKLTVTGDAHAERSLQFLKPRISFDWRPGSWNVQLSAKRTVAQLAFEDFISGAELSTEQLNGGNAQLLPQRAWEFLISAGRKILGDGRIKLDLGYNRISMVQDRIPIIEKDGSIKFDAPGNLGDGTQWQIKGNFDLPLRSLGIKGGRLSGNGSYAHTSVRDPYTLEMRPFSGWSQFAYSLAFRQDLVKFAWGIDMSGNTGSTYYRLNETDNIRDPSPRVSAFVEYRPNPRLTATLGVKNLADSVSRRERTFYAPNRTNAVPNLREFRERNGHMVWYINVKRNFG